VEGAYKIATGDFSKIDCSLLATKKAGHPERSVLCGVKDLSYAGLRSLRQAQGRHFAAQERRLRMTDKNLRNWNSL
jgi:hypothetical protein